MGPTAHFSKQTKKKYEILTQVTCKAPWKYRQVKPHTTLCDIKFIWKRKKKLAIQKLLNYACSIGLYCTFRSHLSKNATETCHLKMVNLKFRASSTYCSKVNDSTLTEVWSALLLSSVLLCDCKITVWVNEVSIHRYQWNSFTFVLFLPKS